MGKIIVYFDMASVLVDFEGAIDSLPDRVKKKYEGRYDEIHGIFGTMKPFPEMVELFNEMMSDDRFEVYLLSTASWSNPSAWSDKLNWVNEHLPSAYKRLILSHNKNLLMGDYLIDDRPNNGAAEFTGVWIHYGGLEFKDAKSIRDYLNI